MVPTPSEKNNELISLQKNKVGSLLMICGMVVAIAGLVVAAASSHLSSVLGMKAEEISLFAYGMVGIGAMDVVIGKIVLKKRQVK